MTLRVIFEVVPFGIEHNSKKIHELEINNIGPSGKYHRYKVKLDGEEMDWTVTHLREEGALQLAQSVLHKYHNLTETEFA